MRRLFMLLKKQRPNANHLKVCEWLRSISSYSDFISYGPSKSLSDPVFPPISRASMLESPFAKTLSTACNIAATASRHRTIPTSSVQPRPCPPGSQYLFLQYLALCHVQARRVFLCRLAWVSSKIVLILVAKCGKEAWIDPTSFFVLTPFRQRIDDLMHMLPVISPKPLSHSVHDSHLDDGVKLGVVHSQIGWKPK